MKDRLEWAEVGRNGHYVRIFKNRRSAMAAQCAFGSPVLVYYVSVVADIRRQLWLRSRGECEMCGSVVTESSGHMHEKKHRGRGGEISLDNSVFICPQCHRFEHKDRNPRWSKREENVNDKAGEVGPEISGDGKVGFDVE